MWKVLAAFLLIGVVAARVNRPYDEARMREAVERQCRKYGAEEHTEEVTQGMLSFVDCLYGVVDKDEIAQLGKAQGPELPKELLRFTKKTCKSQNEINQCFNSAFDAITPCIEPSQRGEVDAAKKSVVEMTDLFCKDDSKKFTEFINDGALTCIESQFYNIAMCMNKIQTLQNYRTISVTEACESVEEVTSCIVKTLSECPKPSTANFVSEVFRTVMKSSNCKTHEQEKIAVNAI